MPVGASCYVMTTQAYLDGKHRFLAYTQSIGNGSRSWVCETGSMPSVVSDGAHSNSFVERQLSATVFTTQSEVNDCADKLQAEVTGFRVGLVLARLTVIIGCAVLPGAIASCCAPN